MSRESVLGNVRKALGRPGGASPGPVPAPRMVCKSWDPERRIASFIQNFEALAGKAVRVPDAKAAATWLSTFLSGRSAVASNSDFLRECGITDLPGVVGGFTDRERLRTACAHSHVGVTSVDYALAETGTMILMASPQEARLISLLPPVHVAIFPASKFITGLDDLFTILPQPAEHTSSMVMITGPSRTADIEQILVRGVHGPGEVYAVIVGS
ncbi:MAG: lactate utilization protein [Acidobacteriaceae bacterium]|nr:lactate utilization protein [Acidobacteriaceae bacterium]